MKKITDRRIAEGMIYDGLSERKDVRVEYLTISCLPKDDLLGMFQRLIKQLDSRKYAIDYAVTLVKQPDRHHAHIFWKKPYIRIYNLVRLWQEITGEQSHLGNKTVMGDKSSRKEMHKVVDYCVNQQEHHAPSEVEFYFSDVWVFKVTSDEGQKVLIP